MASALINSIQNAFVRWHQSQLQQRPFLTNSIQNAVLMLFGDRFAQSLERKDAEAMAAAAEHTHARPSTLHDTRASWTRTAILTLWSSCANSVIYTWWYRFLHYRLPQRPMTWVALTAAIPAPLTSLGFFTFASSFEHLALHPAPLQHLHVMVRVCVCVAGLLLLAASRKGGPPWPHASGYAVTSSHVLRLVALCVCRPTTSALRSATGG